MGKIETVNEYLSPPTHSYTHLPPPYFHSGVQSAVYTTSPQASHIQRPALVFV